MSVDAQNTPMISFGFGSPDAATVAWERVYRRVHGYALTHGLPEIPGYYGADLNTGEFVES